MKDNHPFPFERNRYYPGKMLNSADFQLEQLYMNHKRSFINDMMFGSGILCGLDVFTLDDLSVLIESGAALDSNGREIVLESSVVKKLTAIDGFDRINGDLAVLCLRYLEEEVHPVYSVAGQEGKEYENNHISEGYELFIRDADENMDADTVEDFLLKEILLEQEDYRVSLCIPADVSVQRRVGLEFLVEKRSEAMKQLSVNAVFQLPVFTAQDGSHELRVEFDGVLPQKGQTFRKVYWLNTGSGTERESVIMLEPGLSGAALDGKELGLPGEFQLKLRLHKLSPEDLAAVRIGRLNLEMRNSRKVREEVELAAFRLIRTQNTCLIGDIIKTGVRRYITAPADSRNRARFLSYFRDAADREQSAGRRQDGRQPGGEREREDRPILMASGSLEIPLRMNMGKGEVCYSEEIMHGLGKGNVFVQVGMESLEEDVRLGRSTKSTVYGDSGLFREDGHMDIQTAVKVFNDKGSFQVAAKLLGEQSSIVLLLNWVAVKFTSVEEKRVNDDISDMSIVPETPTVHLPVKGNFYFGVKYRNMKPCRLSYELTEPGSGEISADGVYTAPGKEGVYEIHIYCTDIPEISTYAYAVVSK